MTFGNMRTCNGLSLTEIQDSSILRQPFINRDSENNGFFIIDPLKMQKLLQLLELIKGELTEQDNDLWPCKTRSYLYKILIETEITLFFDPVSAIDGKIDLKTHDADNIILYCMVIFIKK